MKSKNQALERKIGGKQKEPRQKTGISPTKERELEWAFDRHLYP